MGLFERHKFMRMPLWGVACLTALTLASCAGVEEAQTVANTDAAQTELTAENFTTEGKPTKTIETPWGPREIYDPVQDQEVRTAFKKVYDIGDRPITFGSKEPNDEIVLKARKVFLEEYLGNTHCSKVIDATCRHNILKKDDETLHSYYEGVYTEHGFPRIPSDEVKESDRDIYDLLEATIPLGLRICKTNYAKRTISTDQKIIGTLSPEPFEAQLSWFFSHSCLKREHNNGPE